MDRVLAGGLGTYEWEAAMGNPGCHGIGSCARYLGVGTGDGKS